MLVRFLEAGQYETAADEYDLYSCVECGLCSFVCVARIPIFQYIRLAKYELARVAAWRKRMISRKKFIVSHAPFWHNGSSIAARNANIMLAALPAVLFGLLPVRHAGGRRRFPVCRVGHFLGISLTTRSPSNATPSATATPPCSG